jgi:hypothetical protein
MIWRNFVLAVWASIIWCAVEMAYLIRHAAAVDAFYSPFSPRVFLFPIVVGGAQLFLWFRVYRERNRLSRMLAGFAAGFFTLQLVIMGLQASVQLRVSPLDAALFAYFALSHALFALDAGGARVSDWP